VVETRLFASIVGGWRQYELAIIKIAFIFSPFEFFCSILLEVNAGINMSNYNFDALGIHGKDSAPLEMVQIKLYIVVLGLVLFGTAMTAL